MFNGIQPRKYREVLSCLNATVREYPRGAHIVELGEQSHNTGVLLDGTMEEFFYDENTAILQRSGRNWTGCSTTSPWSTPSLCWVVRLSIISHSAVTMADLED